MSFAATRPSSRRSASAAAARNGACPPGSPRTQPPGGYSLRARGGKESVQRFSRWWEASSRAAVTLARAVCVEETRWFPVLTRRAAVVRDTTAPARLAGLSRDWLAARADADNADHADDGGARGPLPNDVVARLHGVGDYAADAHALFCTRRLAVR